MNDETTTFRSTDLPTSEPATGGGEKNNTWMRVAVGGVAGVLIGGIAYAATRPSPEPGPDGDVTTDNHSVHPMAHNVTDDMSFADAFAAARAEVGPGGVFTWRGGVYGTYTAEEWNAMSSDERSAFYDSVSGYAPQPARHYVAHHAPQEVHVYHHNVQEIKDHKGPEPIKSDGPIKPDEVHVVGGTEHEIQEDGVATYKTEIEARGHHGYLLQHGDNRIAVIDLNDNGDLDGQDVVVDMNSGENNPVREVMNAGGQASGHNVSQGADESSKFVEVVSPDDEYTADDATDDATDDAMSETTEVMADDTMNDPSASTGYDDGGMTDMANDVDAYSI